MRDALWSFRDDAYGETAALRYNTFESRSSGFANRLAPRILRYLRETQEDPGSLRVLDVGCGTGQLAAQLLAQGARVVGLDRSPHMLKHASANNAEYVKTEQARFVAGTARDLSFNEGFELVTCTFNSLNHLADFDEIERCLAGVHRALTPGGHFLCDLNTRRGLQATVESNEISDTDEEITIWKRFYDGKRVILYASGCFLEDGRWHRYRETIHKIVIDTERLRRTMLNQGWASVTYTREDFRTPIGEPEGDAVAYLVARKA